jgi:hypothetical protein
METVEIPTEPVKNVSTPLTIVDEVHAVADEEETPKRNKPGRPVGSKSKEPGKPRAPRKAKSVLVVAPVEEQEDLPRVLPGSMPIPTRAFDDTTAVMLSLLQHQAQQRHARKTDLWKSWFP